MVRFIVHVCVCAQRRTKKKLLPVLSLDGLPEVSVPETLDSGRFQEGRIGKAGEVLGKQHPEINSVLGLPKHYLKILW